LCWGRKCSCKEAPKSSLRGHRPLTLDKNAKDYGGHQMPTPKLFVQWDRSPPSGELGHIDDIRASRVSSCNFGRAEGFEPSPQSVVVVRTMWLTNVLAKFARPRAASPPKGALCPYLVCSCDSLKHTSCVYVESRGLHTQEKRRPKPSLPSKYCTLNSGGCQHRQ